MDVDSPWVADPTIGAVTHGTECAVCMGYRSHAFEALCLQDTVFSVALADGRKHWQEEGASEWRQKYKALAKDYQILESNYADARDDYDGCKRELHDADDFIAQLKDEIAELKEKLLGAEEGRARYPALAGKGKQREPPTYVSEPVAKRIRTLSLGEPVVTAEFPALPPPSAPTTPGGKSLRPAPGAVNPYAVAAKRATTSASTSTAGPSPAVGPATMTAGPSKRPGQTTAQTLPIAPLPARVPLPRTVAEAEMLLKRAHIGSPNGTPHMITVATLRRMVAMAQEARRTKVPLTEVQEFVVKNWRVPPGVEKSTDRVERQLGLPPNRPKRRGIRGVHPDDATGVASEELPYAPIASGSGAKAPQVGETASKAQGVTPPSQAPPATVEMVAEPTGVAMPTIVAQAPAETAAEPMEQVQETGSAPAVELPIVEVASAAATTTAAVATTAPTTQRETLINSVLDSNGCLPAQVDSDFKQVSVDQIRSYAAMIEKNPKAVLGFKTEGGAMPPNALRRVECYLAILRNAPGKVALRRKFLVMAMALLLPQGAYAAFLERFHPGAIPAAREDLGFVKASKRTPTIRYVGDCLFNAGVTPLEASQWDEFVLAYCQDYLADPSVGDDDEIRLAMKDRLNPPATPQGYRILECVGRGARVPRAIFNRRLPAGDQPPACIMGSSSEEDWFNDE